MSGVVIKSNRTVVAETNQSVSVAFSTSSSSASTRIVTKEESYSTREYLKGFLPLVGLAQVLGLLALLLIIFWIFHYADGFPSTIKSNNWHIFLLCTSFIYLNGNNILAFRMLRDQPKNKIKLIHAVGGIAICVLAVLGIWASFPEGGFFSYYSLHSWIGIFAVIVFLIQTISGLYAFLYQGIDPISRAALMPYHRYFGQILLVLAIMATVTGINEKAAFKLGHKGYKSQMSYGVVLNLSGFLFVLFGIVVIYIVSNVGYKRIPRPQD